MNKTVNINLGGLFFHIDEDAYQKLSRYFDAIKRSLSDANAQDEIIKDIEVRIAELISEKHSSGKQVISLKELDEIIAVMGQPEDYRLDGEAAAEPIDSTFQNRKTRKLYRDIDEGMIGGVAAGLGHYFGVEKVWIRVLLVALVFLGVGSGIIAYIALWIIIPQAITTSEKLEMRGEPVTISNIEKKVREEFEQVSERFKNTDFSAAGQRVQTGAQRVSNSLGDAFGTLVKIFVKCIGILIILSCIPVIVALILGVFATSTALVSEFPWSVLYEGGNFTDYPLWLIGVLILIAFGVPFFYLMLLGFKLLLNNFKSPGKIFNFTILGFWIISIILLIAFTIAQIKEFAYEGRTTNKQDIAVDLNKTLLIQFAENDDVEIDPRDHNDFQIYTDSTDKEYIYSEDISFEIRKSTKPTAYVQIVRRANGNSSKAARHNAEEITYNYTFADNTLTFNKYLITDVKNKFRDQEVEIILYLPEGVTFKTAENVRDFDITDNDFFNLHYSSDEYLYKVYSDQVKCLTCPESENEFNDVIQTQTKIGDTIVTKVQVGRQNIETKTTEDGTLIISENGTVTKIKTK